MRLKQVSLTGLHERTTTSGTRMILVVKINKDDEMFFHVYKSAYLIKLEEFITSITISM